MARSGSGACERAEAETSWGLSHVFRALLCVRQSGTRPAGEYRKSQGDEGNHSPTQIFFWEATDGGEGLIPDVHARMCVLRGFSIDLVGGCLSVEKVVTDIVRASIP